MKTIKERNKLKIVPPNAIALLLTISLCEIKEIINIVIRGVNKSESNSILIYNNYPFTYFFTYFVI